MNQIGHNDPDLRIRIYKLGIRSRSKIFFPVMQLRLILTCGSESLSPTRKLRIRALILTCGSSSGSTIVTWEPRDSDVSRGMNREPWLDSVQTVLIRFVQGHRIHQPRAWRNQGNFVFLLFILFGMQLAHDNESSSRVSFRRVTGSNPGEKFSLPIIDSWLIRFIRLVSGFDKPTSLVF